MCVLAFAINQHPRWRLVAIANRDEFHDRAAAPLARWDDGAGIVAGRDLVGGGTWLGLSETGRFVALTNLRSDTPPDPAAPSRGGLVTSLLNGSADPGRVALAAYNPFNLVCIDADRALLLTNRPHPAREALAPGSHGLTNGPHLRPWPKLAGLQATLGEWLERDETDPAALFAALADESVPPGAYDEATASPVFIRNPVYGTRCSTVTMLGTDGCATIIERRFSADGKVTGETRIDIPAPAA